MPRPLFVLVFALTLGVDLFTKYLAVTYLEPVRVIEAVPWLFQFTWVENRGVAFGLGAGWDWLLPAMTVVLIVAGLWWSRTLNWRLAEVNIVAGLILGGALGNLIDRLRYGYVVDFLDFAAIGYPWVFNIADSAIVVSVIWIMARQFGLAAGLPSPLKDEAPRPAPTPQD